VLISTRGGAFQTHPWNKTDNDKRLKLSFFV